MPGDIFQFKREVRFGENRNSWQYFPVLTRGVCRSEPKFPTIFTNLNARRLSVRTEIPGDISQLECEDFFGQIRNSWRYFPV